MDSYIMSAHGCLKLSFIRNTGPSASAWTRLYTSVSISGISGPQNVRLGTCPRSLPRLSGDRGIGDEQTAALPHEEPENANDRERQAARKNLRGSVHDKTGGLRHTKAMPGAWHQVSAWIKQEIYIQLSKLRSVNPQQGLCEGQRLYNQQASQQHKELCLMPGTDQKGLCLDEARA